MTGWRARGLHYKQQRSLKVHIRKASRLEESLAAVDVAALGTATTSAAEDAAALRAVRVSCALGLKDASM